MIQFSTLLLLFLAGSALYAQGFSSNLRINDDPVGKRQSSPQVTIDRLGTIYVAWTDYRSNSKGDVYLSRSTDGGTTFSSNIPVYTGGSAASGSQEGVQMAIGPDGALHLVWVVYQGTTLPFIAYLHSTDGGTSFSTPKPISGTPGSSAMSFPSIAIDSSNNIYVAWVDDRELRSGVGPTPQVYLTVSNDGGTTFSQSKRATRMSGGKGGSCECCNTSMAASPDGELYISFRSDIDDRRDIFIARSLDRGETFVPAIAAASEEWHIEECPTTGSSIALDKEGTAHVVWRDSRPSSGGKNYIYYTTLRSGDTSCAPNMRISGASGKSNFPTLALTPDGAILVLFEDNQVDEMNIYATYSLDGGNTFTPLVKPTDESSATRQDLVSTSVGPRGERYAVWQDRRRDDGDIYFARDMEPVALTLPDSPLLIEPHDGGLRSRELHFQWNVPANLGDGLHTRYSLTYERVEGGNWQVDDIASTSYHTMLEPGTYRWHITASTLVGNSTPSDTFTFIILDGLDVMPYAPLEPPVFWLSPVAPNPLGTSDEGSICFSIPRDPNTQGIPAMRERATLKLYDLLGRDVCTLFDAPVVGGEYTVRFTPSGLPRGGYIYCLVYREERLVGRLFIGE